MKPLYTLFLLLVSTISYSQTRDFHISFDTGAVNPPNLVIDIDTNYPNNKWQIGKPNKTVFIADTGGIRAMVTDTVFSCVPSDTSVFTLKFRNWVKSGDTFFYIRSVSYYQMLDIDTGDAAYVDLKDYNNDWQPKRKDTIATPGWHKISYTLFGGLGPPPDPHFRFTFITDTSTKNRDGWMLDSFTAHYIYYTGIESVPAERRFTLYPNPASGQLYISISDPLPQRAEVIITDMLGRTVKRQPIYSSQSNISVIDLPDGVYICTLFADGYRLTKKITVSH